MFRKYGLPIISAVGILAGGMVVYTSNQKPPIPPIPYMPATSPYNYYIAASGIIEASSENVAIGVPYGEIVTVVNVQAGDIVKKGDPLFNLDTRVLQASYEQEIASRDVVAARLHKLIKEPRPETLPPLEAIVEQKIALYEEAKDRLSLYQKIKDVRAVSVDEMHHLNYQERAAYFSLEEAKANLALKKAGSWIEDIMIASKELEEKEKAVAKVQVQIDRYTIRAPFDGQVLQLNTHLGEYVSGSNQAYQSQDPFILFGAIDPLHVRIDIDEEDAWRYEKSSPATAFVRGNSKISFPLTFVRIEPYVIPKQSLTGDNTERVDTRVLQVIYSFEKKHLPVYTGQILDIYIQAPPALP